MTDLPPLVPAKPDGVPTTRDVLAILSTLLFGAAFFLPWIAQGIPHGADQYVGMMQGAVIAQWTGTMSWYFGSSKDSATKTDTAAVQAATIAAMTPDQPPKP